MTFHSLARRILGTGTLALLAAAGMAGSLHAQILQQDNNQQGQSPYDPTAPLQSSSQQQQQVGQQQQTGQQQGLNGNQTQLPTDTTQTFQPTAITQSTTSSLYSQDALVRARESLLDRTPRAKAPPKPGEFEDYVERLVGRRIPKFGQDLVLPEQRDFAAPSTATVPPDYLLNVGDTVEISFTGTVNGALEREIDTDGKIFLPNVGAVQLAGVRFGDLKAHISAAVGSQFRDYTVSVAIKKLRGIRVYVTGFANNPGAFTVSSLSTLANAVFQAGGPSGGGSFRSVKLYRDGHQVADFDLYQLLRHGDRLDDLVLQNEDVLFIPPAGEQVAVIGSVPEEAVYELLPGESLEAMLQIAGGPNVLGDPDRLIVYKTQDPQAIGPQEVARADAPRIAAQGGDILQVLSKGSLRQPIARQSVVVRIEGEVNHPGNYYLPPNTPVSAVIAAAGGMTARAYPFGAKLERQSVREQQKESYKEAIRQFEFILASAPLVTDESVSPDQRVAQAAGAREILDQLRKVEPDGRVVMLIPPNATELPASMGMENNDHILIPSRPTTVGVFGAIYRPGSFLLEDQPLRVKDYIDRAGGVERAADRANLFVVRANGEVLTRRKGALNALVLPGDVVFVPVKTATSNWWNKLKDATTVLFDLALSAAVVNSLK